MVMIFITAGFFPLLDIFEEVRLLVFIDKNDFWSYVSGIGTWSFSN
jgi:hypothetical protein